MSVTLTISEEIYKSLEQEAHKRELESVEQFLEKLTEQFDEIKPADREEKLAKRRRVVGEIREFRQRMKEKYGVMKPDSTEMLREDRMRG